MSVESQLVVLENEVKALCAAFSRAASSLTFYHKQATAEARGNVIAVATIGQTRYEMDIGRKVRVLYKTSQGANTIASLRVGNAVSTSRIPHSEGAAWIIDARSRHTLTVTSIFDGKIIVENI